ncbi:MAG: nucleoside-diphosphate sugar epimerase/dehydratase [Firmicutes bacterium]|nr:polysaccharide biosynthesis protein [Clostridiales bacterium]MDD5883252.1 nucleoside-diphosphate sugar epimerase/dehydratase [Bacillota bacterium]
MEMKIRKPGFLNRTVLSKILLIMALDVVSTMGSFFLGLWFRYDFSFQEIRAEHLAGFLSAIGPWCAITVVVFACFRLYSSIWAFVSTSEVFRIIGAYLVLAVLGVALFRFDGFLMPRASMVVGFLISFLCTVAIRFSYRLWRTAQKRISHMTHASGVKNVMLIGAGDAGRALALEFNNSDFVKDHLSCVIDDNPVKLNKRLCGAPIVGNRYDIPEMVKQYKISKIIFAIPSCSAKTRKEILDICAATGCEVQLLPGIFQMVNGDVSVSKLRRVDPQDLLGRDPIQVNLEEIFDYIHGKVVLVTGGGGSIGSELCRQIAGAGPKQLIIFDIYENNAYDIQMELKRNFPELNLVVLIGSVRNTNRVESVVGRYQPDLIFHAAAHKHVPLMEDSPNEAIKNNVFGTYKLAKAAAKYGVKRFVLISTDKAVNPTNIMGASKRLCEMVVQMMNRESKTEFVAVRFGNVLGSNGSVIPLFKKQIEEGGPVTVTHPDVIRYFMTIPEAVSLVLQAGYYAKGGEIFVLDMGEPVKIDTMARNMIRLSGYEPDVDIKIVYTGLRPGEKLYEELLMKEEGMQETANKLIHIGKPIEMDDEKFRQQLERLDKACKAEVSNMKDIVAEIVPTYKKKLEV